jgi:hypothetical protein
MSCDPTIRRSRRGARNLFVFGALVAAPATLSAQKTLCLNGSPLPECSSFLIVELQGVAPVIQTSRPVRYFEGAAIEENAFGDYPQWELGMMRNVGDRWALGGAARIGPGGTGFLTGLTARGRRWLTSDLGVDVSAGATFHSNGYGGRKTGPLADVRLNFRDDLYAGVRYESIYIDPIHLEHQDDPGGRQHALSLLLGMGSEWAMGGSAAMGLALLLFLTTVDFS